MPDNPKRDENETMQDYNVRKVFPTSYDHGLL